MMPPLISYQAGMFALQEGATYAFCEWQAACHHEAAHAVAMYVFGTPIAFIGVREERVGDGVAIGGAVRPRSKSDLMRIDHPYNRRHFVEGVISAAGPAGERRYRHEAGCTMIMLGATEGDHESIDARSKAIAQRGRCGFAYRRLVWFAAQRLVGRGDIWQAVEDIADAFFVDPEFENDDGATWASVEPREAYAICRRAGLRMGMLNN